jgi:TRAP-type C4-dicarboxylate transport system permease small subunit
MEQTKIGLPALCSSSGGEASMNKFFHCLDKVSSGTNKVFIFVASLMMAGLMIIVCVDLTLRYVFNSPLIWGTEVTEILILYITFLGAAQVFRENSHVVIDIFLVFGSPRRQRILRLVSCTLVGIVSAVLVIYGFSASYNHYVRGVFNPTIIETPIALIIMIIPIGCVPLFMEVILKVRKLLRQE